MQDDPFGFSSFYVENVDQILINTVEMYSLCQMLCFDRSHNNIQK